MENIDEDIKRLENLIGFVGCDLRQIEADSIERILTRLKTAEEELEKYKKIEEEIKQKAHYCLEIPYEHCKKYKTVECGKCIIEWARKKVEDEIC